MKNLFKTGIVLGLLSMASCQDELTQEPIGLTTLEQANSTPTLNTVETAVASSYELLSNRLNILAQWDWAGGLVFQNDYIMQDIASDDMEKKWNSDGDQAWMDEINNFTFTSTNGGPNGLWKYNYEGIKRLNIAIELLTKADIETITGISTARKNQLLGEAYFLRSNYYFSLVTNFGDVPLILSPVKTYQEAFEVAVRTDKTLVWDQIKSDLTLAKGLLPNSKFSSTTEKWRASKGAVIALQAKAALYTQKWSEVVTLVDELASLGYSLNANYFDNFNASKEYAENEVIFSYDHQSNSNPRRGNGICAPLGWGFFAPSTDFLNSFEPNDPRKFYTVDVANQNINKMLGSVNGANKGNDDASTNKVYMRYADALLWKAEALNETGNYSGAIAIINQIRARARTSVTATGGTAPVGTLIDRPASTDKATVKGWLISERRAELGFENQRMMDLKRWGIAKAVMTAHGKNFQDKHILYPIPQSEIDASAGTLTQNSGY
ncbi:RagB/SusD family nutrient uptake outer membrane protein [Flavobacterium sp. ZE23DGlu08]|uniref:RagB/SusD family nutrient uptake outer membrane protein n=1 Tax=Flavobacterium sp. ZE23DGlu08 TaxID=3059026 RepID=UPI00265FA360|nr:RagB/SusD family nutrient uptake outer membrane protein [Flavobacterium sp. ZE23DGlu08]WKL43866.1 RagB/SusD family nutrient uptake outer membrane protein [Flavobacterium sp. ZE23DGlu08]